MGELQGREHFIPLRRRDLVELLCSVGGPGGAALPAAQRRFLQSLSQRFAAHYHLEFQTRLETLKDAYAPFDPDADTLRLEALSDEDRRHRLDRLFTEFDWLLERANFRKLGREQVAAATQAVSPWGLNLDVDFDIFERLEVYARGDVVGRRSRRRWRNWWRPEEVDVPTFQRIVLILKQRPHKRLGQGADTQNVYLKLFKDIPKEDIEMLLPGGTLKMPGLQRGKLGASLLGTFGFVGYKIWTELNQVFLHNPMSFYAPLSVVLGYGYRQYSGIQVVRRNYSHQLTQSLYYQNLDNNLGVIHRLLDAAEEQECREAILAYFYLWIHAGPDGWTADELDALIEQDLQRRAKVAVDFEVADALDKLARLGLVNRHGDRFRAIPAEAAVRRIGADVGRQAA